MSKAPFKKALPFGKKEEKSESPRERAMEAKLQKKGMSPKAADKAAKGKLFGKGK